MFKSVLIFDFSPSPNVQSRGTDGDGREVKVSNWLGCALQGGHHLGGDEVLNQLLSVESLFLVIKDG